MSIRGVKGMNDLLPGESERWQQVEQIVRELFAQYRYREIRTPIVEPLELFVRSLGETTGIVEKEMYSFDDQGGKTLALRPEGTAAVVRSYIEHHYDQTESLARLYYMGPMFRRERPQKGRYRQFHQIGVEVFGSNHPLIDAEIIHVADQIFKRLGVEGLELEINSLGCPICRPNYVEALTQYLESKLSDLCEDCQRRFNKNPLRILDCKQEGCQTIAKEAPSIHEHLCEDCEGHFDQVLEGIGHFGFAYAINPQIVRGLDYYQKTAFEFTSKQLGAQNAVAGGGRYDGLVRLLGGPHVPGIGFAIGVERLMELISEAALGQSPTQVYIAAMGPQAIAQGIKLAEQLRQAGVAVEGNYDAEKSLKALMKRSDKINADFTILLGEDELKKKQLVIRNMKTKEQSDIALNDTAAVVDYFKK